MKRLALSLISIFCFIFSYAQDTPNEFADRHNYIYQYLNRNEASTGILLDYGIEFQNMDNFKGTLLVDSNYVGLQEWRLLYTSLLTSK